MIDILANPEGADKLKSLGIRNVPVIIKGDDYIFAQNLREVARFVEVDNIKFNQVSPEQLISKWLHVLSASQRYIQQVPEAELNDAVISGRDRSIRDMGHHIFRIGEAFLETAINGAEFASMQLTEVPLKEGEFTSGSEIADYGQLIISRLNGWWAELDDRTCEQKVNTFFGVQPLLVLFERSTWHSAQHARQLINILERYGIEPNGRLTEKDFEGLPLPASVWG